MIVLVTMVVGVLIFVVVFVVVVSDGYFFFSRCMMVQEFVVGFCGSSRCVLGEGASES